ncbi:unnamed protein product [Sphagnum jensenii]|uniref:Uncharacterized protein n=1 Tax=Sphagnum jensenii TaxID=128206 RepID=A0ABP0VW09_9BRYO
MIMIMVMYVGALWRKTVDNSATILYMGDDDNFVVQGSLSCWLRDEQSQVVAAVVLDFYQQQQEIAGS